MSISDWAAFGTLIFGGMGLILTVRRDLKVAAQEREDKEDEFLTKIDKKFEATERRLELGFADVKSSQSDLIKKVESVNKQVQHVSTELRIHKESPGHAGTFSEVTDLKKMVSDLAAAIARKS